jgi:diguanylate cyclase (GGDEF)-like protein/PAS domain S-box-containing protein
MSRDASVPGAQWFEQIAESSGLIFYIMRIRPDVAFEYLGSALQTRLGIPVTPETAVDTEAVLSRIDPEFADRLAATLTMTPGQELSIDLTWRHVDGRSVSSRAWMRASQRPDGSVVQEGVVQDITELRAVEAELRNSEQRHRLLAENAYDVIWTMALDGTITYINPAITRVRGLSPEEAKQQKLENINTPPSAAKVAEYFQQVFAAIEAGTEPPVFQGEMEYYRKDGSIMTGELQVIPHVDADGHVVELLGVTRDISERKLFEAELTRLAVTDPVTGVWNRRHGRELLEAATAQPDQDGGPLSVLMVDIDNFKAINDTYGHQSGDTVLIELARRLTGAVRSTDMVARWGGEEFVILLRDCPLNDAVIRAEKIRRQIADVSFPGAGTITVSIGAAQLVADDDVASWVARSDKALYEAKRAGRNTVAAGERR